MVSPIMIQMSFFEVEGASFNSENIPYTTLSEKLMSIWELI